MEQALVIGLGGTGSYAVAHLKKRLLDDARYGLLSEGPAAYASPEYDSIAKFEGVHLRALDADVGTRPFGGQVLESGFEDVVVPANIGPAFQNLRDVEDDSRDAGYMTCRSFLPHAKATQLELPRAYRTLKSGLGEIRQFGRLVFFLDMNEECKIEKTLVSSLEGFTMTREERPIQVFFVASVAGGTGAGFLVDTIAAFQRVTQQPRFHSLALLTTAFIVLPNAFSGVIKDAAQLKIIRANGYGALREIDRLMCEQRSFSAEWRQGDEPAKLDTAAFDICYMVDGARDQGLLQIDSLKKVEDGLPVAIADSIYAHIFPSSGAPIRSNEMNLAPFLTKGGMRERYSTFGGYSLLYAWEPLMRSCALRLVDDVLWKLRTRHKEPMGAEVDAFLSKPEIGSEEDGAALPSFARDALLDPSAALATFVPSEAWLRPGASETTAPFMAMPDLLYAFPGIGKLKSTFEDQAVIDETKRMLSTYWGRTDQVPTSIAEPVPFFQAVNHNTAESLKAWEKALVIALCELMNRDGRVAGLSKADGFLAVLSTRLETLANGLARIPLPDTQAQEAAVSEIENNEMKGGSGWGAPARQRRYLAAQQDLLGAQYRRRCQEQVTRLADRYLAVVTRLLAHERSWQVGSLKALKVEATERREAINKERADADATPMRRYVPLPGDAVEEALYLECLGKEDEATKLPEALLNVLRSVSWSHELIDGEERILFAHPFAKQRTPGQKPPPITLNDLLAATAPPFMALRTKSVFEILEKGDAAGDAELAPEAMVREVAAAAARLTRYDASIQMNQKASGDASGRTWKRDHDNAFATWQTNADDPGGKWSIAFKAALEKLGYKSNNLDHYDMETEGGQKTPQATEASLPVRDKIIVFSERHLLAQAHFTGISSLRTAYEERVASHESPWPHVLPAEDAAARLEMLSAKLVNLGYLKETLRPLAPAEVTLCSDFATLQSLVACMAEDVISWSGGHIGGKGAWSVSAIPSPLVGGASDRVWSEKSEGEFVAAVGELMAGRDKDSIDSRAALMATAEAFLNGPDAVERLKAFAESGWQSHENVLPASVAELFQTTAAAVAARVAKDIPQDAVTA